MSASDHTIPPLRPRISLEWSPLERRVVAKQALVGLSWRSLEAILCVEKVTRSHKYLADVVEVPDEIFTLKNLHQVLSLETWQTCLSELEKKQLCKLLPEGCQTDKILRDLFSGEIFSFENPLSSWGSSICNGAMHPDAIVSQQTRIHSERKNHNLSLRIYHQTMIQNLRQLKDLWSACKTQETRHAETEKWIMSRQPLHETLPVINEMRDITDEAYLRQRLKRRRSAVPESAFEKANAAVELAMNEWYKAKVESPSSELRTITVTRKQFSEIANRKLIGQELRLDTLKDVLGNTASTGDELFKSYWRTLAMSDLPKMYKAFVDRVSNRKEMASLIAKQCMHRHPKVKEDLSGALRAKALSFAPKQCGMSSRLILENAANGKLEHPPTNVLFQSAEDDELASIQELWSYNCLRDAPFQL